MSSPEKEIIIAQAVDDVASLAFLVSLMTDVPPGRRDCLAEKTALWFLSKELDIRATKIMEVMG